MKGLRATQQECSVCGCTCGGVEVQAGLGEWSRDAADVAPSPGDTEPCDRTKPSVRTPATSVAIPRRWQSGL